MKKSNWKVGLFIVGFFVLFVVWTILVQYITALLDLNRTLGTILIFSFLIIPFYIIQLKDIIKIKDPKRKTKQVLYFFIWPLIILSFIILSILINLKIPYPHSVLILLLPGVYVFVLTIKYKEFDERYKHHSGNQAIVVGFSYLLGFFALTGLPLMLIRNVNVKHREWLFLVIVVASFVLPRLIYRFFFKDKSRLPVVTYTLQEPDFFYEEGSQEISVEEAIKLVRNFEWHRLLEKKKKIDLEGNESCHPQLIFNSDFGVFSVICEKKDYFKIYLDIQVPNKRGLPWPKHIRGTSNKIGMEKILTLLQYFFENKLDRLSSELRLA